MLEGRVVRSPQGPRHRIIIALVNGQKIVRIVNGRHDLKER